MSAETRWRIFSQVTKSIQAASRYLLLMIASFLFLEIENDGLKLAKKFCIEFQSDIIAKLHHITIPEISIDFRHDATDN